MKTNIYWIPGPWTGSLAILPRPRGGDWLVDEIQSWCEGGVEVVVSVLAEEEAIELGLANEAHLLESHGLRFIRFPIRDYDVPSSTDELRDLVDELECLLDQGHTVGIHCRAGIGRSSLVAACLLVKRGEDVKDCFERISSARGVTVPDTVAQREWVGDFARVSLGASRLTL